MIVVRKDQGVVHSDAIPSSISTPVGVFALFCVYHQDLQIVQCTEKISSTAMLHCVILMFSQLTKMLTSEFLKTEAFGGVDCGHIVSKTSLIRS